MTDNVRYLATRRAPAQAANGTTQPPAPPTGLYDFSAIDSAVIKWLRGQERACTAWYKGLFDRSAPVALRAVTGAVSIFFGYGYFHGFEVRFAPHDLYEQIVYGVIPTLAGVGFVDHHTAPAADIVRGWCDGRIAARADACDILTEKLSCMRDTTRGTPNHPHENPVDCVVTKNQLRGEEAWRQRDLLAAHAAYAGALEIATMGINSDPQCLIGMTELVLTKAPAKTGGDVLISANPHFLSVEDDLLSLWHKAKNSDDDDAALLLPTLAVTMTIGVADEPEIAGELKKDKCWPGIVKLARSEVNTFLRGANIRPRDSHVWQRISNF